MDADVTESRIEGRARAPPSKSYTHRAILAGGYATGALVHEPLVSADTRATAAAVEALGGDVAPRAEPGATDGSPEDPTLATLGSRVAALDVTGFAGRPDVPADVVDCANSGTTMRLLTAASALADGLTVLTGDASLRSRPQGPLLDAIEQLGGRAESTRGTGRAPLVVGGPVSGGPVSIPGDVSSQFVSALLMAGAVTDAGVDVRLETELKSAPYVDVTVEVLDAFGVSATATEAGYRVPGGQAYDPVDGEYHVPGDFSSISYLLAAGAIAGDDTVSVAGAYPGAQGDTAIVDVLERMGADLDWDRENGIVTVRRATLSGVEVAVGDTPDLLPTIAALGAVADGTTRIVDAAHVRYKETDRVSAMAEELERLGAVVEEAPESLAVHGGESDLHGTRVDGRGDHRVVMALAVAALAAEGTTTIAGAEHVDVSFPGFFDVLFDLGADVDRQ